MNKKFSLFAFPLFAICLSSCSGSKSISIVLSDANKNQNFHTTVQSEFLNNSLVVTNFDGVGSLEQSYPNSINLDFSVNPEKKYKNAKAIISTNPDLNNAKEYSIGEIYNLNINTEYYYKITAKVGSSLIESDISSFKTADEAPRNLKFETLNNTRDLGGWKTLDGKHVKQGMLYRSPEFNESYGKDLCISKNDKNYLLNELGIKTDIDLRRNDIDSEGKTETGGLKYSVLAKDINYVETPMVYKGLNILTNTVNKDSIKLFFDTLSIEDNYPMVFHCAQGKDRTGCMAYVLNALLGVEKINLERDYMFTNFAVVGGLCDVDRDINMKYGATLLTYEKSNTELTLQQRTYDYLNQVIGVSTSNLDKIISLLVE